MFPWAEFVDLYLAAGGVGYDPAVERFYTVWQNTWRHVECVVLGEDFFHPRSVPMMIAGLVFGPRFLAAAVDAAFTPAATI